ncbi:MAG: sarcosine oxidase subunit gamma family protein [Pseudomonadota bacterium]
MHELQRVSAAPAVAGAVHESGHFVRVAESGLRGQVTLRGDLATPAMARAVNEAVGLAVPDRLRGNFDGPRAVLWMARDELMLLLPHEEARAAAAQASAALSDTHHLAIDVSDARTIFTLTGENAAALLAKGAPVDLSATGFPVGTVRRTHLGEIAIAFWRREETVWEVMGFRSTAPHLAEWLRTSSLLGAAV